MTTHSLIKHSLIGSALLLISSAVSASTCDFSAENPTGNNPLVVQIPLQGTTLSAGRDLTVGATLYRQTYRTSSPIRIYCPPSVTTIRREHRLTRTPPLVPGRPEFQGKVYESGVPGIGVAIWIAGTGVPYADNLINCGAGGGCNWNISPTFDISLIKTGPISGGTIRGDRLPGMTRSWVTGNIVEHLIANFTGTINVVVPTCTTTDVNVPLGSHMVHSFKGNGSATNWRDFQIDLRNCPAVSGYFNGADINTPVWNSDGSTTPGVRSGHSVSYRLTPQAGTIDAARGIARLNASRTGDAPAATGIGVQIANRSNLAIPLGSLVNGPNMPVGSSAGASYSIPLRARYIQVADTVTPGPANAAVEFLLNYQ